MLVNFRLGAEELARSNRLLSRTNEHLSAVLADVLAQMRCVAPLEPVSLATTDSRPYESLSKREKEIMLAISSGDSLKAIATDLGLSIKTISTYKKRIFTKMGFKNDTQLISHSLKNNLLPITHL
jgi:DNA-binding NarL/FixJ family response regulator